jgi:hypothetical protein
VEHERAGVLRDERVVDRPARLDIPKRDVRRDPRRMEVDGVLDDALFVAAAAVLALTEGGS